MVKRPRPGKRRPSGKRSVQTGQRRPTKMVSPQKPRIGGDQAKEPIDDKRHWHYLAAGLQPAGCMGAAASASGKQEPWEPQMVARRRSSARPENPAQRDTREGETGRAGESTSVGTAPPTARFPAKWRTSSSRSWPDHRTNAARPAKFANRRIKRPVWITPPPHPAPFVDPPPRVGAAAGSKQAGRTGPNARAPTTDICRVACATRTLSSWDRRAPRATVHFEGSLN